MSVTPLYSGNIDTAEMINYIKEILNVNVESKDDVEVKIITPSASSENDGLAELYYNKMVGPVEEKDFDYYATIEFIKEVLNYTADDEEVYEEVAEPVVETVAKKATTKKAAAKTSCKKKAEMIEEAAAVVEEVLSEDAERIRSVARMGILFG
jgi:topoisomerase IA-like protein